MKRVIVSIYWNRPLNKAEEAACKLLDKCMGLLLPNDEAYELLISKIRDALTAINAEHPCCNEISVGFNKTYLWLSLRDSQNIQQEYAFVSIRFANVEREWKGGAL